jgi:hypothetical protein
MQAGRSVEQLLGSQVMAMGRPSMRGTTRDLAVAQVGCCHPAVGGRGVQFGGGSLIQLGVVRASTSAWWSTAPAR